MLEKFSATNSNKKSYGANKNKEKKEVSYATSVDCINQPIIENYQNKRNTLNER